MSRVLLGSVALVAAAGVGGLLTGEAGGERAATAPAVTAAPARRAVPRASAPPAAARNVFEYGEAPRPAPSARPAWQPPPTLPTLSTLAPLATPVPPPVRLVGLVRRGGVLKAALVISGETVVLAPGETAAGYTVTAVDEDSGVRLRGPGGEELRLRAEGAGG